MIATGYLNHFQKPKKKTTNQSTIVNQCITVSHKESTEEKKKCENVAAL